MSAQLHLVAKPCCGRTKANSIRYRYLVWIRKSFCMKNERRVVQQLLSRTSFSV